MVKTALARQQSPDWGASSAAAAGPATAVEQAGPARILVLPLAACVDLEGGADAGQNLDPRGLLGRLFARLDASTDLAEEIGTPRWYRGLALMIAVGALAMACWPGLAPVQAASAFRGDDEAAEQLRSAMLMPLASGGETGRRMGPGAVVRPIASVAERPRLDLVTTLGEGESVARMLQRAGAGPADADGAARLLAGAMPREGLAPGTRIAVTLGQRAGEGQARALERVALRARIDLGLTLSRAGSAFVLARQPIAVDDRPIRIRGEVGPGLYLSARAAGAPALAIQQYLQTIDTHVGLDEVRPGDQFDLIVDHRQAADGTSETGDLLYAGLIQAGRARAQLMRWGGKGQFYDAAGISGQSHAGALVMPVAGHLTSGFGMRFHPILGYSRLHAGIDLAAPWGSPIYAVANGLVTYAGVHGGHGNFVRLDNGGGIGTGYGHMSRIAVAPGMTVSAGQVIGYVGSTGLSTGPHLHYEVYRDGVAVDPMSVRFTSRAQVDTRDLAAFKARLARLLLVR